LNRGSNSPLRLVALYVHPIKSCAAVAVERAQVTPRGLRGDRRWMIVDGEGRFVTQRTRPELALIGAALDGDRLRVSAAGQPSLTLPALLDDGPRIAVEVWSHRGEAVRHDEGSAWLSRVLGSPVQLVCMPDAIARPIEGPLARAGEHVSFADEFPYLIASASSLDDLNTRSNFAADMRRFRPNLVIAGAPPWAEDDWRALRVGGVHFRLVKPCARCSIPSVDPDTAAIGKEPLRTLGVMRRRDNEVFFGVNAIADDLGELRVGDPVTVDE
jgi:uncharacterized protein YcbX